jgi:hypothetical protein
MARTQKGKGPEYVGVIDAVLNTDGVSLKGKTKLRQQGKRSR